MTPEAQRIAIAEACGWSFPHGKTVTSESQLCRRPSGHWATQLTSVPDYLNDLNAMHEAEKTLTNEQYNIFALRLGPLTSQRVRSYLSATAAQRAEAFLRTLNLWDDSK